MPPILKLPAEIIAYTSTFLDGHEVDQWAHTDFDNFLEAMLCTPGVCETPPTPTTAFWHTQLPTIQNLVPEAIRRRVGTRLLRLAAVSDTNLWLTQILVTVYRILTPQQSFCV
jgi:hypothetical protein